jgi:short subunit dehydrogenase-like uncharacterized protein
MHSDRFDFVIFGATGFTGGFVVDQMAKVANDRKWAVAGRSDDKLKKVLKDSSARVGHSLDHIPTIVCDVANEASLATMAKKAKVVLNCVGPYRFYGEPVVKACVENGASHVDISGEPIFLEGMCLKYNDAAQKAGVYIIGACGWDSIPCDMGVQYAIHQFDGTLNSVETVAEFETPKGFTGHFGTFQTMIHGIANRHELKPIRKALTSECPLPKSTHKLPARGMLFYHEGAGGWCIPFMGSDKSVVTRTMRFNYKTKQWRPIQVQTYMKVPNLVYAILLYCWGVLFFLLASLSAGRRLMESYPKLFTFGAFSHEGPNKEQVEHTKFKTSIFGKGWRGRCVKAEESPDESPSDNITCTVDGGEPGYVATSALLVASALTILDDKHMLPDKGGVMTPGAAFTQSKLVDRLEKMGVHFKKVE